MLNLKLSYRSEYTLLNIKEIGRKNGEINELQNCINIEITVTELYISNFKTDLLLILCLSIFLKPRRLVLADIFVKIIHSA